MNLSLNLFTKIMRIAILGGTFSPIHYGHIKMAEAVIENNAADQVLFMVAGNAPHKRVETAKGEHRYNMVNLVCDNKKYCCSDLELNKETNYTFDTLTELSAKNPENEYYFITGADMFLSLPKWYRAEELMKNFKFIAIDREGSFIGKKEQFEKVRLLTDATFISVKTPDISSTMVRDAVKQGKSISSFVPKAVEDYIKENGLYL